MSEYSVDEELGQASIRKEAQPVLRRISSAIHRALMRLEAKTVRGKEPRPKYQLAEFAVCRFYTSLCLLSYLDVTPLTLGDAHLWKVIHWLRPDYLLAQAELVGSSSHAVCTLVALQALGFVYLATTNRGEGCGHLQVLFPLFNDRVAAVAEVSLFSILAAQAFTLIRPEASTHLLQKLTPTKWLCVLSLVAYILYVSLQVLRVFKTTQFQHSKVDKNVTACAGTTAELVRIAAQHGLTISYYTLSEDMPYIHLGVALCCVAVGLLGLFQRLPYYAMEVTAVGAASCGFVGVCAASVLWASVVNSALFASFGVVFAAPLVSGLTYYHTLKLGESRMKHFADRTHKALSVYQFELGLRKEILACTVSKSTDSTSSVIAAILRLNNRTERFQQKRFLLWVVDLALYILKNESLARVKLAQARLKSPSFESDLIEARLHKELESRKPSEHVNYLRYIAKMRKIKADDKRLCHMLQMMYAELCNKTPDSVKVMKTCRAARKEVRALSKSYEDFILTFPSIKEGLEMYSSFLADICHLTEKAEVVSLQGNLLKEHRGEGEDVSLFNADTGIVFVACGASNLGIITFANTQAHTILGYQLGTLSGSHYSTLIPQPYGLKHARRLANFMKFAGDMEVRHPTLLYLCDHYGWIIECYAKIKITASLGPPMMILAFRQVKPHKDFAIISEDGVVTNASNNFGSRLNCTEALGRPLSAINPVFSNQSLSQLVPFPIDDKGSIGLFAIRQICSIRLNLIYLLTHELKDDSDFWAASFGTIEIASEKKLNSSVTTKRRKSAVQFGPLMNTEGDARALSSKGFLLGVRDSFLVAGSGTSVTRSYKGRMSIYRIRRAVKLVKFTSVLLVHSIQVLVLVVCNVMVGTVVNSVVQDTIENDNTKNYVLRDLDIAQIAMYARYIEVTEFLGVASDEITEKYMEVISNSARNLTVFEKRLRETSGNLELKLDVIVWELLDGEAVMKYVKLLDAVRSIADHALTLRSLNRSSLLPKEPNLFYVFRNGIGETKAALEYSIESYILSSKSEIEKTISMTFLYFLPPVGVLVLAVAALLWNVVSLHRNLQALVAMLLGYPVGTYIELKQSITDRLSFHHGEEPNSQAAQSLPDQVPRCQLSLIAKGVLAVCCFLSVSVCFYCIEYFVVIGSTSDTLLIWPTVIELAVKRISGLGSLWTWMLECAFSAMPGIALTTLPGPALVASPGQELGSVYTLLKKLESRTLAVSREVTITADHFQYSYEHVESSCWYLNSGFHNGLLALREDTLYIAYNTMQPDFYPTFRRMLACVEEIVASAESHINRYYVDLGQSLQQETVTLVVLLTLHSVVCCAVFLVAILTGAATVLSEARAVWKVLSFFPQEPTLSASPRKALHRP